MEKQVISGQSLCKIIRECARCGVAEFSYGEIKISFLTNTPKEIPEYEPEIKPVKVSREEAVVNEKNYDLEEELEFKNEESTQLLLEDPAAYEELMLNEDIEDQGEAA